MPNAIRYGRALYYPYINFQSDKWLKTASLFYEGINRIVPTDYNLSSDSEIVKELNDSEGFIKNVNPDLDSLSVANDFLNFVETELLEEKQRNVLYGKLGALIVKEEPLLIHNLKVSSILREKLRSFGLINIKENADFIEFEPLTGAIYMTFLANELAQEKRLPVVTDDPIFQPLIRSAQFANPDNKINLSDNGHTLASMVIETVVPENIDNIPISKIIAFRKKYSKEQHSFYNEVNRLVEDLPNLDDATLKDFLHHRKKDIDIAVSNLKGAFTGMNLATTTALLSISTPTFLSGLGTVMEKVGFVTIATSVILTQRYKYYKSKNESPYSYILSLEENLNSQTLLKQLVTSKIII